MSEKNDGGFVYPQIDGDTWTHEEGITRRDWLAGLAMQGMLSEDGWLNAITDVCVTTGRNSDSVLAEFAYDKADAMIAEGEKQKTLGS